MDPILIPIAVTGAFLLGGVLWKYVFCEQARHKRTLRRATRRPISEIKDGEFAKVVGRLRLAETPPLEAPLTSRPCAYFEVKVEEKQSSGRSSHWETIVQTMESQETIFVEDDSGKALVTLAAPQVVLHMDTHLESGFLNDASPRLEAFLAGRVDAAILTSPWREQAIAAGAVALAEAAHTVPHWPLTCGWGQRSWIEDHRELTVRFIRALADAADWALAAENRDSALGLLMEVQKVSRLRAEQAYALMVPKVRVDPAAIQAVIDLRIEMGAYPPPHDPPERFFDLSYWTQATG